MATAPPATTIRYEGPGDNAEAWGFTQANFSVGLPGQHVRELAVMLNSAASNQLAELAGREHDPAFRADAAREVGQLWIEELLRRGRQLDPLITVSRAVLEAEPGLAEKARTALAA